MKNIIKRLFNLCVDCSTLDQLKSGVRADTVVSKEASSYWDLVEKDTYCWACWDSWHWEYQDYDNKGYCHCDLCNHNYNEERVIEFGRVVG
jgi:hypothetical protein